VTAGESDRPAVEAGDTGGGEKNASLQRIDELADELIALSHRIHGSIPLT